MFVACLSSPTESREQQHVLVRKQLIKNKLCQELGLLNVPHDLRFTTFDDLLVCADELEKEDPVVESVLKKAEALARGVDSSALTIHFQGRQVTLETYISRFQWDDGRFPRYSTVAENLQTLSQLVKKLGDDIMLKASAYADLNNKRLAMKNDAENTYMYRDLTYVITPKVVEDPQDFIDTEHLTTVVVFVPAGMEDEWLSCYMTLSDMVVPNCAKRLEAGTSGHSLWRVLLFKSHVERFVAACESRNYVAKPFVYSEARYNALMEERSKLEAESSRHEAFLSRIYRVAFSDIFTCWIHLKAMRAFCEAVLKFGLPVSFTCFSIWPTARASLNTLKQTLASMLPRRQTTEAAVPGETPRRRDHALSDAHDHDAEPEYDSFVSFTFTVVGY
ncbi:V-type proton ATPase subunit C, putative [Babesia caballi]|uniref:V-type proton ATPase subunit C n=1 Tax=Babesia caballi TaxID=5871 RepID=A0AAV4LUL6_BABCB|nr:V-type proton ATPase subunit C, putative [Babesia caballi]